MIRNVFYNISIGRCIKGKIDRKTFSIMRYAQKVINSFFKSIQQAWYFIVTVIVLTNVAIELQSLGKWHFFIKHCRKEIKNKSFMMFTINCRVFYTTKNNSSKTYRYMPSSQKKKISKLFGELKNQHYWYNFISQVDVLWKENLILSINVSFYHRE